MGFLRKVYCLIGLTFQRQILDSPFRGAKPSEGALTYYFAQMSKNCMELREFFVGGEGVQWTGFQSLAGDSSMYFIWK